MKSFFTATMLFVLVSSAHAQDYTLSRKLIDDYRNRYGKQSLDAVGFSLDSMSQKSIKELFDSSYVNVLVGDLLYSHDGGISLASSSTDSLITTIHRSALTVFACNYVLKINQALTALDSYKTGVVMDAMGYSHDAIRAYSHAIDNAAGQLNEKELKVALSNRAKNKYITKDLYGAISDLDMLTAIDRTIADPYFERSVCYIELKKYDEAANDLNYFVQYAPNESKGFRNRGLLNIVLGQKDTGCKDLSRAGELGDDEAYRLIEEHCRN